MPILDVEVVGRAQPGAAKAVVEAAAQVFDAAPGTVWVKLREIDHGHYAENTPVTSIAPTTPSVLPSPVFVRVLKRSAPADAGREHWALARAIGAALNVAHTHVHITYESPAIGRLSFGGDLVE